jgi:2-iminobutanoate/2-iminopropanoate deaminase
LKEAGCSLNDVVKTTVHLTDINLFSRYNNAYREAFKDVEVLPARTTVQSVLSKGIQIEIDCIARKPHA